jgi:flagellar hook-basal body complex protein FliE
MTATLALGGALVTQGPLTESPLAQARTGQGRIGEGSILSGPITGPQSGVEGVLGPNGLGPNAVEGTGSAPDFGELVRHAVGEVNAMEDRAARAADGYLDGRHEDVHGTMIAMQEADVSLRLAVSVRNRVIEAYREVMRMGA